MLNGNYVSFGMKVDGHIGWWLSSLEVLLPDEQTYKLTQISDSRVAFANKIFKAIGKNLQKNLKVNCRGWYHGLFV